MRAPKEALAGAIFICLAAFFAFNARTLDVGTPGRMGPGFLPMALCGLLAIFGLCMVAHSFLKPGEPLPRINLVGIVLVTAGVVVFGLGVTGLGFLPSMFIAVFLAVMAARKAFHPLTGIGLTIGVTAFCWAVFIWGLGLPLALIGPWLGG